MTAPNVTALNRRLPEGHAVNGRRGEYFWTVRGQLFASGSFRDIRARIADHMESMGCR